MQDTIKKRKKTQHAYNNKEKNSNQQSQTYHYSHFYFKAKQKRPSGAVRTAKRTKEALRQIFLSHHHYLMKARDCNINKKNKEEKPQKDHTEEKREIISETHLTASGVCTTIRPENSGM
jgi:hypothetical protein